MRKGVSITFSRHFIIIRTEKPVDISLINLLLPTQHMFITV